MIFYCYYEETNAYRLYNPQDKKLLVVFYVIFDEKEEW